ncbi:MAG: protein kinase domain-containing protein [Chloroflexota bacterium]
MKNDDPLIGVQLSNFRIDRLIGRGGMARVYYGWDVKLERPVAIKVVDTRYWGEEDYARRFVEEARLVASWRHDHIIQVYYADDQDGLYYFVMEYVDGQDLAHILSERLERGQLMPHAEVLRIGWAIAHALDYAHRKGVVHRDIKPSNVLVAFDGRVVLGDFGLALDQRRGSRGQAFGTPHYISPEQARRSSDAVPQSDLYSFAVILYEMLTGVIPFDDPSSTAIALKHLSEPPPLPSSINPSLSAETDAVLINALSKLPEERYPTALALMRALENVLKPGAAADTANNELPPPPVLAAPSAKVKAPTERISFAERSAKLAAERAPLPSTMPDARRRRAQRLRWLLSGMLLLLAIGIVGGVWYASQYGGFPAMMAALYPQTATHTLESTRQTNDTLPFTGTASAAPMNTEKPATPTAASATPKTSTTAASVSTTQKAITGTSNATTTTPNTAAQTTGRTASVAATHVKTTQTKTTQAKATQTKTTQTEATDPGKVTPSATGAASSTPSPTPTVIPPTLTPTPEASTATALPSPTPTNYFVLYYDESSFYMQNKSGSAVEYRPFAFERLDVYGNILERFDGKEWARFAQILPDQWCSRLEIMHAEPFLKPAQCGNMYGTTLKPPRNSEWIFWTAQGGSTEFRVLWENEEVGRCEIGVGLCEFWLTGN